MEVGDTANPIRTDGEEEQGCATLDAAAASDAGARAQSVGLSQKPAGFDYEGVRRRPAAAALRSFVAVDPVSVSLLDDIRAIAVRASSVLVRGESGSGKDMAATLLHYLGRYPEEPLLRLNCVSLPRELIEAELFGQEDRSVSGTHVKPGHLELAGAGTLVIDEIVALPMAAQAKLLRVITERRFERVGSVNSLPARARIVALTSVNLEHALACRTLREDLYYRLNVASLLAPPLRERPGDIRPLAETFLARMAEMHRKPYLRFSSAAIQVLQGYSYPGNVRELRQIVQGVVACVKAPEIREDHLPGYVRDASACIRPANRSLEQVEREHIAEVLDYTRSKKTVAARILGISRKTLLEKRKRYQLP